MLPTGQQQPNRDRTEWSGWAPSTASSHDQHSSPHPAHTQAQPRTTTMEAGTASHLPVMAQGAAFTSEGASDVPGYTSQHPRLVFQRTNAPLPPGRVSCDCCRIRKIKCTAEKPTCANCVKRKKVCTYPKTIRRRGPDKNPGSRPAAAGHHPRPKQPKLPSDRQTTADTAKGKASTREVQQPIPWEDVDVQGGDSSSSAGLGTEFAGSVEAAAAVGHPLYQSAPPSQPSIGPDEGQSSSLLPMGVPTLDPSAAFPPRQAGDSPQPVFYRPRLQPQQPASAYLTAAQSVLSLPDNASASSEPTPAASGSFIQQHIPPNQHTSSNQQISTKQQIAPNQYNRPAQPLFSDPTIQSSQLSIRDQIQADIDAIFVSRLLQGAISSGADGFDSLLPLTGPSANGSFDQMGWVPAGDADSAEAVSGQLVPLGSSSSGGTSSVSPLSISSSGRRFGQAIPSPPREASVAGKPGMSPRYDGQRGEDEPVREEKWSTLVAPVELSFPPGDIQAAKDGWWAWILLKYSDDRQVANRMVINACSTFFSDRHIWLNFLQPDVFFHSLFFGATSGSSIFRLRAAPHMLLAILAHVTLLREGHTREGQRRAFVFADEALSLISYCIHAGSQDPSLFAAGLILTVLEIQPHVNHSTDRVHSFMGLLNGIGLSVYAHHLDADERTVSTSLVGYPRVRSVSPAPPRPPPVLDKEDAVADAKVDAHLKAWAQEPLWNPNWTQAEMWKEEMRRMCWCASGLAAHYTLWQSSKGQKWEDLEICHPERFRLLFPGEAVHIELGDYEGGKTTPWAMYHRVTSLWHFVTYNIPLTSVQRVQVLNELRAVEDDQSYIVQEGGVRIYTWLGMCWIMLIRRLVGALDKQMLLYWFRNQIFFFNTLESGLPGFPGIVHRPLHCWWYILQAYCSLEMSAKYMDMWDDADQIYANTLVALDQIAGHWHCEAALAPFVEQLKDRHAKVLKDRQEVTKGQHEAERQMKGWPLALTPAAAEWKMLQVQQWEA